MNVLIWKKSELNIIPRIERKKSISFGGNKIIFREDLKVIGERTRIRNEKSLCCMYRMKYRLRAYREKNYIFAGLYIGK